MIAGNVRYVVMGVSGVGKSAVGEGLADALGLPFVEGDALHPPANIARMAAGVALTDDDRRGWLQAIAERLREARQRGSGLIVTCSALKRRYRDVLRDADPQLQLIYLHGARALVADRLAQRAGHFMPPALLGSQYDALEPPGDDEAAWTIDVSHAVDQIVARLVVLASGDATPPLARDEPA